MANGINANLLRRWMEAEASGKTVPTARPAFVALPMPNAATLPPQADIRIEVRRGATAVNITWPVQAAGDCAVWLRELLR
jgi:transposase